MAEELAICRGPAYGNRDFHRPPGLWFSTSALSGEALQCFEREHAFKVIQDAGVYDIKDLEGMPCIVEVGGGMMKFVRWHK